MEISGKRILVLGGGGMVGHAVCELLLHQQPSYLVVASRHEEHARDSANQLKVGVRDSNTVIQAVWGDVFRRLHDEEISEETVDAVKAGKTQLRESIKDIIEPLDDAMVSSSLLAGLILGQHPALDNKPMQIVIDCMNTATAIGYQNVYANAQALFQLLESSADKDDLVDQSELLLGSLNLPQLVRHIQLLYAAMRRAETEVYIKVGTSGTGGMGFDLPFTHGEEKPSRLLLSKAALAGAQSMLIMLLARTHDAPTIVKEIKPAAMIGWRAIHYGPITNHGQALNIVDCDVAQAVEIDNPANLVHRGEFGVDMGRRMQAVFIDTGENGQFSADEFAAITAPGMMQMVTPEEIAHTVIDEILGASTGAEIVSALNSAVMSPSYRAGYLRSAALAQLRRLEAQHGDAVAFEILGPPRLSKLLFEAYLIKNLCHTFSAALSHTPRSLGLALDDTINKDGQTRRKILSIGVPILLSDGVRLLRGPVIKTKEASSGWVDFSGSNMAAWQQRLRTLIDVLTKQRACPRYTQSSQSDQLFLSLTRDLDSDDLPVAGELVAWIFDQERGEV